MTGTARQASSATAATSTARTVDDAMIRTPKTWGVDLGLDEACELLAGSHLHAVLLVEGDRLRGVLVADDCAPGRVVEQPPTDGLDDARSQGSRAARPPQDGWSSSRLAPGESASSGPGPGSSETDELALSRARLAGRTVVSGSPLADAERLLSGTGHRRLAVVDDAGDLVGLLCLKRRRDGFCTEEGVEARRRERAQAGEPGSASP